MAHPIAQYLTSEGVEAACTTTYDQWVGFGRLRAEIDGEPCCPIGIALMVMGHSRIGSPTPLVVADLLAGLNYRTVLWNGIFTAAQDFMHGWDNGIITPEMLNEVLDNSL